VADHHSAVTRRDRDLNSYSKESLRQQVNHQRHHIPDALRVRNDNDRTARLLTRIDAFAPELVACYVSTPPEPGTLDLLDALHERGIRVVLPWLPSSASAQDPQWAIWDGEALKAGFAHIPTVSTSPDPNLLPQAQIIILPGLAGTRTGIRLGTGGGWYDRGLLDANPTTPRWLLLGDDEVFENLPHDPWDQPVSAIVTPSQWIVTRSAT